MFNFNSEGVVLKKVDILAKVSEEDIFVRYLGINPAYNTSFCNPLRDDKSPGCTFYIDSFDRIKFRDHAKGFNWDCFNVVEYLFKVDFKEAMRIIAVDFGLIQGTRTIAIRETRAKRKKEAVGLRVQFRSWNKEDVDYWWGKYRLKDTDLEPAGIFPISQAWYDKGGFLEPFYWYRTGDPGYAYCFGQYDYKLYFPRKEKRNKFRQNRGDIIQGLNLLPPRGHILVHTKSYKDVICINKYHGLMDIWAIASMSESQIIPLDVLEDLQRRFDYHFTLFDFDRTGIRLRRKYENIGIPGLMFGMDYKRQGIKDFADHREIKGPKATAELLKYLYEQRINS